MTWTIKLGCNAPRRAVAPPVAFEPWWWCGAACMLGHNQLVGHYAHVKAIAVRVWSHVPAYFDVRMLNYDYSGCENSYLIDFHQKLPICLHFFKTLLYCTYAGINISAFLMTLWFLNWYTWNGFCQNMYSIASYLLKSQYWYDMNGS